MVKKTALLLLLVFSFNFFSPLLSKADELQDVTDQLTTITKEQQKLSYDIDKLGKDLGVTQEQINDFASRIGKTSGQINQIDQALKDRKAKMDQQISVRNARLRAFYRKDQINPFLELLGGTGLATSAENLIYQQAAISETKHIIESLNQEISSFEKNKADLLGIKKAQEANLAKLTSLKNQLAIQKSQTQNKLVDVENKIKVLSARQQAIISAKSGTFTTTVGDVPMADDPNASPTFNPGFSPAFGAFSFGAYSHRNGMSQYGAKARADSGQPYSTILAHYYPDKQLTGAYSEPGSITVDGYGSVDFQQYLYGIAEMPSSWNKEALRAQAVAARSYALAYTNNGSKSICADEHCQVYIGHSKGGDWEQAVKDTRGVVLTAGGAPVSTQYSSTTGGYLNGSGWDTVCGSKDCWTSQAYEKMAASPWFYKGWYTEGYSVTSANCGRTNPWLTQEEMADVLNAYLVQGQGGVDAARLTPVTTSCWGGNPYSMGELRDLANSVGGGTVTSVSSVSVSYSVDGVTASVSFSTNRAMLTISGSDFKTIFNLRTPGYISIRSPLYNMESK